MADKEFKALGSKIQHAVRELETFPSPQTIQRVVLESDEFTSLCPVTGQPDWGTVTIEYVPDKLCIESKSLKLYLWSFREEGAFCESLTEQIAKDIGEACKPLWCRVIVNQKPRGGVRIIATSFYNPKDLPGPTDQGHSPLKEGR